MSDEVVDKLGGIDTQIRSYVEELNKLNYVNSSPKPKERKNLPEDRSFEVNSVNSGLETTIKKAIGENPVIGDKVTVDKLLDAMVAEGTKLPDSKEKPKEREQAIHDYLSQAGVSYNDILTNTIGLRSGVKINDLPDGHPLKALAGYIAAKKVPNEDRVRFLQRQIVTVGGAKPSSVAEIFNSVTGTNLDPKTANPQQALGAYNAVVQAQLAQYRANDPNLIYNKKAA